MTTTEPACTICDDPDCSGAWYDRFLHFAWEQAQPVVIGLIITLSLVATVWQIVVHK